MLQLKKKKKDIFSKGIVIITSIFQVLLFLQIKNYFKQVL